MIEKIGASNGHLLKKALQNYSLISLVPFYTMLWQLYQAISSQRKQRKFGGNQGYFMFFISNCIHLVNVIFLNYVSLTSFTITSNTSSSLLPPHSVKKGILERPKCQHHYQDVLASFVKPCLQF